jgi:hypothetical protein
MCLIFRILPRPGVTAIKIISPTVSIFGGKTTKSPRDMEGKYSACQLIMINEIVKYRIDLYTVDKLMDLAERLHLDFDVEVA